MNQQDWVNMLTDLMDCWNKLDGRVIELTSWVGTADSALPGESQIGRDLTSDCTVLLPGESQTGRELTIMVGSTDSAIPG